MANAQRLRCAGGSGLAEGLAAAARDEGDERPIAPTFVPTFEAVYREHASAVSRWTARLGGPAADVQDLVHDVFLIVQRKLPTFRPDAKITTWLYRITERVVGRRRRRDRLRGWLSRGRRDEIVAEVASTAPDQLETLRRRQDIALVYRVLDRLRESDRNLLVLFEIEDLSGEEIAQLLGIRLPAVWVRLNRARARFLDALRRHEGEGVVLRQSPRETDHVR